jgi:bifunctional non-homologous end joining protein LigD
VVEDKELKDSSERLLFVVQKHRASRLHYDFRLEVGGVMPSWSIPKGPSLSTGDKRLAMQTTDHPLEYRTFEGVIPEGGYGAGPVMIWDTGYYVPEVQGPDGKWRKTRSREEAEEVAASGLRAGDLKFTLYGKKLRGSFALIRTKGFGGKPAWLLIKHRDRFAVEKYDANDLDYSAVSRRSMDQIAGITPSTL